MSNSSGAARPAGWLRGLAGLALPVAAAATLGTLLAPLAGEWWVGQAFGQLRPQYAVLLLLCLPVLALRYRRAGWLAAAPLLINLAALLPLYLPAPAPAPPPAFTALHYSLGNFNRDFRAAFAYLRGQNADLLSLQEVTPLVSRQLAQELPHYRVVYVWPRRDSHGSALLLNRAVAWPAAAGVVYLPAGSRYAAITATLTVAGREVAFLGLHLARPLGRSNARLQQAELAAVAEWSQAQQAAGRSVLIMGDLNLTPWSDRFRGLLAAGQLLDSGQGFGYQPTWPAAFPPLLSLPIDHALHSADLRVVQRGVGPNLGSDHAPLSLAVALPEAAAAR